MGVFRNVFSQNKKKNKRVENPAPTLPFESIRSTSMLIYKMCSDLSDEIEQAVSCSTSIIAGHDTILEYSVYYGLSCSCYLLSQRYSTELCGKLIDSTISYYLYCITLDKHTTGEVDMAACERCSERFMHVFKRCFNILSGDVSDPYGNPFRQIAKCFIENINVLKTMLIGEIEIIPVFLSFSTWFTRAAQTFNRFHIETSEKDCEAR